MVTDTISAVLAQSRTIAVVGLSARADRPSYDVTRYMQSYGYRIIPVNPQHEGEQILGELCYDSLTSAVVALKQENIQIDIVNCFRRAEFIPAIADEAIRIGAACLWMQLGIVNQVAVASARAAGMRVVMDSCIKIDHRNWLRQR